MADHVHESGIEQTPAPPAPAAHYRFEYLFFDPPPRDLEALQSLLERQFREVSIAPLPTDLEISVAWGETRERFTIGPSDVEIARLADAIEQSWQWRDAERIATRTTHGLVVTHHLSGELAAESRILLLRKIHSELLGLFSPAAVHLPETCQLMEPKALLEAFSESPYDPLYGFMNIRLYKVEGHERGIGVEYDETIMDTLGLNALGFPDLQMHYKHLDPSMVAELLDDTAHYVLEKGAVIQPGHTLRGFAEGQEFTCDFEGSILDPWRVVIEIDPGKPYSIGTRPQRTEQ